MTLVMVDGKEDREHYFFDAASFYLQRGPVPTAVPLSQITSVTRTSDRIYGRYVWQVCFSKASGRKCVTFTNNLTLFNRDFLLFLRRCGRPIRWRPLIGRASASSCGSSWDAS